MFRNGAKKHQEDSLKQPAWETMPLRHILCRWHLLFLYHNLYGQQRDSVYD
jgi:hypothetical protein